MSLDAAFIRARTIRLSPTEHIMFGHWTCDIQSQTVYFDAIIAEIFGLPEKSSYIEMPMSFMIERLHPADQITLQDNLARALQSGIPGPLLTNQLRIRSHDDQWLTANLSGNSFADGQGHIIKFSGTLFADMTETMKLDQFMSISSESGARDEIMSYCLIARRTAVVFRLPLIATLLDSVIHALKHPATATSFH